MIHRTHTLHQLGCVLAYASMGNNVWDVIHKEVMDWRDSSWTSMNLLGNKTCENTVQPCVVAATKSMLNLVGSLNPMPLFLGRSRANWTGEPITEASNCAVDLCTAACELFHPTTESITLRLASRKESKRGQ